MSGWGGAMQHGKGSFVSLACSDRRLGSNQTFQFLEPRPAVVTRCGPDGQEAVNLDAHRMTCMTSIHRGEGKMAQRCSKMPQDIPWKK